MLVLNLYKIAVGYADILQIKLNSIVFEDSGYIISNFVTFDF